MSRAERDATLAGLREAVEQTKALYEGAKQEHASALQRMKDLGMTHPDGTIRHAEMVYRFTFSNYRKALYKYNRYMLDCMPVA